MLIDVVGWDNGFDFEKIVVGWRKEKFPSVTHEPSQAGISTDLDSDYNFVEDDMVVNFKGADYFVGKKAIQQSSTGGDRKFNNTKFREDQEKVKLIAGLELMFSDDEIIIDNLCLGLNIEAYKSYKKEIEELYSDCNLIYKIKGKTNRIYIKKATCFPQGIGGFYDKLFDIDGKPQDVKLADARYGLIDIGGKTVDGFIADGTDTIRDTIINLNKGTTDAFKRASKLLGDIPFNLVEEKYLEGKDKVYYNDYHDISTPCKKAFDKLGNDIFDLISVNWSEHMARVEFILLCGGGAESLKDFFEDRFNKRVILIDEPQFSNAKGYFKLGKLMARR